MKRIHLFLLACGVLFCSCADDLLKSYEVGRPDNLAEYAYLTDYAPLKEYVDHSKYPNFKLGVAVSANDYVKKQLIYALVNSNFEEVVAGNEMKMSSCVADDGSMDFAAVTDFVETAEAAGIPVYGHTLAWHSQQPVKWLNALVADRPDPDYTAEPVETVIKEKRRCIRVNSDDMAEHEWDTQFWLTFPDNPIAAGDSYEFSIDLMANKKASAGSQTHTNPGGYIHWAAVGTLPFEEEWTTYKSSGSFSAECNGGYSIAFNLNDFNPANIYYFDNISLKINGKEVIKNGDCEGTDVSSFVTKEQRGAIGPSTIVDETEVIRMEMPSSTKEVEVKRNCIMVESDDRAEHEWDTQFWLYFPDDPIPAGASYEVKMNVRADKEATSGTQTHTDPGSYIHWSAIGTIPFKTEWTEFTASGTFMSESTGGMSIAFNLNDFAPANRYYFDDISLKINGKEVIQNGDCEDPNNTASFRTKEKRGATVPSRIVDHYTETVGVEPTIPLTPEEKLDVLTTAMRTWIQGMMEEGCKGKVHAFDVVNEAISGGNPDGEGVYALQHANPENADDAKNNFYWQDHMGDLEYVRTAVKAARDFGPQDVKLFINDYNLESDWDNNGKLKSLIKWIERWEADGVTKIDGIGTQMHISCYLNEATQEKKKQAIENMFKLMAATGKLVRVSELDMGLVDENGNNIATADVTEEQHHKMAELYTWIIQKYLEIIPANQQWGICQWCVTDSPANSGWRANQPVGLWDLNYNRKHTYAGFADGLSK